MADNHTLVDEDFVSIHRSIVHSLYADGVSDGWKRGFEAGRTTLSSVWFLAGITISGVVGMTIGLLL